ncbi:MAG: hypothetical protein PHQ25_02020 [Acidobacteriota bacterium]|nr:hypothetical protein [Acidobacteriota bacterium]MDW3228868.1 hypothetical protein [Acidobacteriota bacterium]MDY0231055.1 hypothetical protein [Candidatus Saccharicenans sp.]
MKKFVLKPALVLGVLLLIVSLSFSGGDSDDYKVIKKAVQDNPKVESAQDVKWFKLLVVDNTTGKEKVRITLPFALVEILARCADDQPMKMGDSGTKLDIEELIAELKKAGPMSIVEINEEKEKVKIWLE